MPLANLIAFVAVPAHRQIVFMAGADLVSSIFITTAFRAVAIWTVKTNFVQTVMRNMTAKAYEMESNDNMRPFQRIGDEL